MTPDWLPRAVLGPTLLAACLSAAVLATPPALAQDGGGSGAARAADGGSPASTGQGSGGQPGQAQPGPTHTGRQLGHAVDDPSRARMLEQERAAGVAAPAGQRREQLQDLNEIARQIAPSVPVPAPGLEGSGSGR